MCCVCTVFGKAIEKFRNFSIWEIGVFKLCLMSFGVLVGTYMHKACKKMAPLLWIFFIASYAILIYKLFVGPATEE